MSPPFAVVRLLSTFAAAALLFQSSVRLLAAAETPEQSNRSTSAKSNPVRLADCRITLIRQVTLACDRPGVLKRVGVREGDPITDKQEVARIADEVAAANLAVAEKKGTNDVDVRYSEKAREAAEIEYRRSADANKRRTDAGKETIVPIVEVEKQRLAAEKAVLAVEQARHELALHKLEAKQARAELAAHAIIAPFAGSVTRVYKQQGEAVRQGDPIIELVNIDRVRIEGRLALRDLVRVKLNQPVRVKLATSDSHLPEPAEGFTGRVMFIDPVVDPVTRETRVWAEVENRGNILRGGLMAEMVIETQPGSELPAAKSASAPVKSAVP